MLCRLEETSETMNVLVFFNETRLLRIWHSLVEMNRCRNIFFFYSTSLQWMLSCKYSDKWPHCKLCWLLCETQWRHSVKSRLYNTPSPILHSVKPSDVTRRKQGYIRPLPHTSLYWPARWKQRRSRPLSFTELDIYKFMFFEFCLLPAVFFVFSFLETLFYRKYI